MPEIAVHALRRREADVPAEELKPGDYKPLPRSTGWGEIAHAVVCCPQCASLSLTTRQFEVDFDGLVSPAAKCAACGFVRQWVFSDWVPEARGSA